MSKLSQYLTLAVSLAGTLGVPTLAAGWLAEPSHQVIYAILVAAAILLHAVLPSIFGAPNAQLPGSGGVNKAGMILLMIGLAMFCASTVNAQANTPVTIPTFTAGTDALAFHSQGQWSVANLTTESVDLVDFGKTKSQHFFLVGSELVAPTPGWNIYGGGGELQPDLTALFKKTNLPSNVITAHFDASVGVGVPSTGTSHVSFLAGGGINLWPGAPVTWSALKIEYGRYGAQNFVVMSTGISKAFGH